MKIFRFDNMLPTADGETFLCNNSLLHYRDDMFLMTFRRMEYLIPTKKYIPIIHPWKMWDNGFKFLHPDPDRVGTEKYGQDKYRRHLSSDRFVSFSSTTSHLPVDYKEFDSTGLAILHHDSTRGEFKVIHCIDNIFGKDMNQDCRILRDSDGQIWLCYNGYFHPQQCRMMKRRMHMDLEEKFIYLYEEQDMIPESIRRPVEKNCVVDGDLVYYGFNRGVFTVIRDGRLHQSNVPVLEELTKVFDNRFIISLGTPPISLWNGRKIAVGHIKIEYRNRVAARGLGLFSDRIQEFIDQIEWDRIYMHGKYIYLMFLFEFNDNFRITRISDAFIPTTGGSHLPYVLSFPTGLTCDPDGYNFWLSYGEGDVRCNVLSLSRDDIENLLRYPETMTVPDYRIFMLDTNEWNNRPRLFHLGYFFEKNCGDDMFRIMFQTLRDKYYPEYLVIFRNHYKQFPEYRQGQDRFIFGGGDIVNPYFLNNLFCTDGIVKDAVSIGIPFVSGENLLEHFRFVCLRSLTDYRRLRDERPVVYAPDLGFLMPHIINMSSVRLSPRWRSDRPRIGICLARTFFHPGNEEEYIDYIMTLRRVFDVLVQHADIYLIPFCTNRKKRYEDDNVIDEHLLEFFRDDGRVIDTATWSIDMDDTIHTYAVLSHMDFAICSRFHSHVFSIALQKPFVSFSQNRKVQNLMTEMGLNDVVFPYESKNGVPINLSDAAFTDFILKQFHQRIETRVRLTRLMAGITNHMDRFITMWSNFIENDRMIQVDEPSDDMTSS